MGKSLFFSSLFYYRRNSVVVPHSLGAVSSCCTLAVIPKYPFLFPPWDSSLDCWVSLPLGEVLLSNRFDLKPLRCQISIHFPFKTHIFACPGPQCVDSQTKVQAEWFQSCHRQHTTPKLDALTLISPFAACQIFMVPSVLVDTPSPPPLEISRQVICRRVKKH